MAKRKTLPKNFEELLKHGDMEAMKAVFEKVDVNARGGVFKQSALAFNSCPDELARWLVNQGANVHSANRFGETPLHTRASHWQGRLEILIELGADVDHMADGKGSPLHRAAGNHHSKNVRILIDHGANIDVVNKPGLTPLKLALAQCRNTSIVGMAEIAEMLLPRKNDKAPAPKGLFSRVLKKGSSSRDDSEIAEFKRMVTRIGTEFEFHRAKFNPTMLSETSDALVHLYELFDVPPVPRRKMHDGVSDIVAKARDWKQQHRELWDMLIPSSGAADTVQGEVIRIAARINDELDRNGGVNWDSDYRKMAKAYLVIIASGTALGSNKLSQAKTIISGLNKNSEGAEELDKWAVEWITLNRKPLKLPEPEYKR